MTKNQNVIRRGLTVWYVLNGMIFWTAIYFWAAEGTYTLLVTLPLFVGNSCLIVFGNKYRDADYKAWEEVFSDTHTFLYKWTNPDPECIDVNYWRNNDSWEIVKQIAGEKKLID